MDLQYHLLGVHIFNRPLRSKNLTFPPPKRNLHGGGIGNGHPYCFQILPWKHTLWPLECTKTARFLYKTCTLARWTFNTTFWVSISLTGPSNPKNLTFPHQNATYTEVRLHRVTPIASKSSHGSTHDQNVCFHGRIWRQWG